MKILVSQYRLQERVTVVYAVVKNANRNVGVWVDLHPSPKVAHPFCLFTILKLNEKTRGAPGRA